MPINDPAPEPTNKEKLKQAVSRTAYRHAEVLLFGTGILIGFSMALIALALT